MSTATTALVAAEEPPLDPLARFGLIASAIGGRPLVVTGIDGPGWTDGRTLFVDRSRRAAARRCSC